MRTPHPLERLKVKERELAAELEELDGGVPGDGAGSEPATDVMAKRTARADFGRAVDDLYTQASADPASRAEAYRRALGP